MSDTFEAFALDILLVEDNPGDIFLMEEILKTLNNPYHIHSVQDGEKALAFLHQQGEYQTARRPDLIVLDLNLPKKNGYDVIEDIKDYSSLNTIPILVLTTVKTNPSLLKCEYFKRCCYITKPNDLSQFSQIVDCIKSLL